ncbi:MAG: hypothetical protein C0594_04830 [Marinilabiliales bacterium]|nr:MAG: hypothetical protein C0594_04830 [Marinilabiliales bacterium]
MVKRFLFIFALIIFGSQITYSQDPEFSQFYANRLYLNPAFAGEVICPRVAMNYRNQWPALGSTYVTYSASYDQYVDFLQGGIGFHVFRDVQGDGAITSTYASLMYAYTFPVNRNFSVKAALQYSVYQRRLAWDFVFPSMIHPLYGVIYPDTEYDTQMEEYLGDFNVNKWLDVSAGMLGFSKDYYFGIAVHHLTQPTESFRENSDAVLPAKWTGHFGTNIPITGRNLKKGELFISPNILYQQQMNFQQLNYGIYANRKNFVVGVWLRQNFNFHYDSFIVLLGFSHDKIKTAYSYDLTISQLRNQTLGAHEVSVIYQFPCPEKKKKFRQISCPSF